MKTRRFRAADGRICIRIMTAEEIRESRRYWAGIYAVAVGFFLVCVIAAGFI